MSATQRCGGTGPLAGLHVVEFAGLGPAPFCGMMLADMGAEVVLVERPLPGAAAEHEPTMLDLGRYTVTHRGKRLIALDIKKPEAVAAVLHLIDSADALIEGFRPGVMDTLVSGLRCAWGATQTRLWPHDRMGAGTLAQAAGHDINYVALSGLLAMGSKGTGGIPWIPPTIVGDMGGGAMFLAFGLVCGLFEARRSGKGQVVDAAITDGAAMLGSLIHGVNAAGFWGSDNPLFG